MASNIIGVPFCAPIWPLSIPATASSSSVERDAKKRLRLSSTLLGLTEVGKVLVDARFFECLLLLALSSGIGSYRHFLLVHLLLWLYVSIICYYCCLSI